MACPGPGQHAGYLGKPSQPHMFYPGSATPPRETVCIRTCSDLFWIDLQTLACHGPGKLAVLTVNHLCRLPTVKNIFWRSIGCLALLFVVIIISFKGMLTMRSAGERPSFTSI